MSHQPTQEPPLGRFLLTIDPRAGQMLSRCAACKDWALPTPVSVPAGDLLQQYRQHLIDAHEEAGGGVIILQAQLSFGPVVRGGRLVKP